MSVSVLFWRRTDLEGFERLELSVEPDRVTATSTVICVEAGGFRLDHHWKLDPAWRVEAVTVDRWNAFGQSRLQLERAGTSWRVADALRYGIQRLAWATVSDIRIERPR